MRSLSSPQILRKSYLVQFPVGKEKPCISEGFILFSIEGKRHNPREEILFFVVRKLSSSLSERPNACRVERDSPFRGDNLIVQKPVQFLATFLWLGNFRKEKRVLSCVKASKNSESPPKVPPFAPTTSNIKESRVSSPESRSSSSAVARSP
ncbi:unnamed protein product [Orchesella dallaii]|uniref:Uncharacterized protein n=1 Tax=Orchesella dallaii TaxID=48710 RepID=A0ABP1REQ7_9HEXA